MVLLFPIMFFHWIPISNVMQLHSHVTSSFVWSALCTWSARKKSFLLFAWTGGRCPCPWQGEQTKWVLRLLPAQTILWFMSYWLHITQLIIFSLYIAEKSTKKIVELNIIVVLITKIHDKCINICIKICFPNFFYETPYKFRTLQLQVSRKRLFYWHIFSLWKDV